MHKKSLFFIRYLGGFCIFAGLAGLTGCVTAPRPIIIAAPPPPAIVYQPAPVYHPAPAYTPAPTHRVQGQQPRRQLSDGQILGILTMANNAEIREAQLALHISRNPRVRQFAQQMIYSHSRLNDSLLGLSSRLGLRTLQSPASQHLSQTAQQAYATLSTMRGRHFDRVYINHQIATHRTVLNGINKILLPETHQASVRGALLQSRTMIARHLQYAQAVQTSLR